MPNFAFVFVYKMDTVTSMKALNKTVEASQLTSDLGGTFTYSHTDWLQFHQVLNILYRTAAAVVSHLTITVINCGVSRRFRQTVHPLGINPNSHTKHSSSPLLFNATFNFGL